MKAIVQGSVRNNSEPKIQTHESELQEVNNEEVTSAYQLHEIKERASELVTISQNNHETIKSGHEDALTQSNKQEQTGLKESDPMVLSEITQNGVQSPT